MVLVPLICHTEQSKVPVGYTAFRDIQLTL